MPDNISKLYNELKETYELGSEDDFRKYLSDSKNREALRKELESEYDVGDEAAFSSYLGFGQQPQAVAGVAGQVSGQQRRPEPGERIQSTYRDSQGNITHADSTQMVRGKVATVEIGTPQFTPPSSDEGEQLARRYGVYNTKESLTTDFSYRPNEYGEMPFGWGNGQRIKQLNRKGLEFMNRTGGYDESYDQAAAHAEQLSDAQLVAEFNKLSGQIGDAGALANTPDGYAMATALRAYSHELRARDIGFAHGSENKKGIGHYRAAMQDPEVRAEILKQENMSPEQRKAYLANAYKHIMAGESGQPDVVMLAGTMIHAKDRGMFPEEAYNQVVGIINNEHAEDVLAGAMQSADTEIARLEGLIEQRTQHLLAQDEAEGMSLAKVMQHAESGSGAPIFNQRLLNDPELSMLWTAKRAAERRKKVIERKQDNHGFMRQFIGTFWDTATDINTWDFGIQDMRDAVNLASFSGNESLSVPMERARQAMLQNTVDAQEAEQRWKLSAAQRWGVIGGQALPFVAEFIGTGGGFSGVRQGVTKGVTSFLERSLGKAASNKAAQWLVRSTGMLTGDIASALLMTNTTGSLKTYSDILDRKTGDLMQLYDGTFVYRNSTTMGDAILKGEVANTLEYYTEMLGNHLDGLISGVGKRLGLSRLSEGMKWLTGRQIQQLTTNVLRQGGINELPSEILEEEANLILNAMLVGDNNFDTGPLKELANKFGCNFEVDPNSEDYQRSIFNPETQADIWGGMLFSIGAMRAPSVAIGTVGQGWNAANYYYYKHKTDLAGTKLNGLVGGDELLDRINNTTNEQIPSLVAGILADDDFTPDMKSLAMDYIGNLVKERGYNVRMFDNAKDLDPEQDQEEGETVDLSYQDGYNAADEEQAGVKERVDVARAWLYNLGFDDSNIESLGGEMPEDWLAALSDEQREAVEEYRNAMAAYEGMLQHVQDDMEGAIAESEAAVDAQTHIETGAVHHAVLKTGGEVWVVGGNVALTPEGNIDIENSDGDLIVLDPATGGKRMIHISDLATADEPVMADQLKEEAATTIQETMATDASNRIDGVLSFQPGDEYTLPFGEEQHTITIIGDAGDGVNTVVSVDGGEQQLMPMQMIQEAADAQREARIAEQAAMEAAASQQQPVEQEPEATEEVTEEPVEEEQPDEDAMPMNGDEVDWLATSPERGHRFLYDEAGLSPEEADAVVANSVKDAEKELEKVSKKAPKPGNAAQLNKYRAEKAAHEQQVAAAQAAVDYWKGVQATQEAIRQQAEAELLAQRAEEGKQRSEAAAQTEAEKEAQRLADREAARQEREALNGVPDVVNDKPEDARARGFRNVNGERVDRQLLTNSVGGRTGSVKFSTDVTVPSRIAVIEADELQPSHIEGQRNPLFFLDEAQPKNRTDQASDVAAEKIAKNINPEEITGDGGAYQFSAPTVNERGEVVQGNNRSSALKRMWSSGAYADSQQRYKQYLIDHAEEFSLNPKLVASMNRPVMVNEISVDDAEAIRLGQMSAKDLESGGIERIDPVTTARKLGPKMRNFASVLLSGEDENMSLAELIAANGEAAVKWLADSGVISPTQVQSAWNPAKTGLTAEAKLDLQNILRQQLFQGGVSDLPHMFEAMPAKAQKAILSTFMRDMDSADADRILPELQHAIEAWYGAASGTSDFSKATNYEAASRAMLGWTNVRNAFSGVLPSEKFSKFAIELANRLQGSSMRNMVTYFNEFYDLVQGTGVGDLFGSGVSGEKLTLAEAIAKIFNVDINETNNGQERSEDVGSDRGDGQEGRQGEPGDTAGTEPAAPGAGAPERGGRAESNDQSVAQAEAEVDTEPTDGQKEAGNYKKGHVKIDGFDVTIEQPKGSVRSGVDASGKAWSQEMHNTYGYIRGTEGVDGDHIDVFLSDHLDNWNGMVYVVDQVNKDGSFDEHKVMYGFDSEQEARDAYLSNYEEGWTGLGNITGVTREEFRKWVDSSHRKTKPFAEYKSVKVSRPIQGLEGYTEDEILADVRAFIEEQLEDAGIEGVTIKGMALHGSRMRGDARPDGDLDVVVEYEGDISEDAFFNLVNYDLNFRGPNGIIIDINPITRGKSGTLEQYMERSRRYDEEKRAAAAEATEPVQSTGTGDQAYTITPTKYTTKKNKELDVWLVKFSGEIDKKQATEIAKETRGWWDREQGGFLMRSEEAARDLAERVTGATSQSDAIPEQPAAGNKPAETGNKPANTRKKSGKRSAYVEQQIDAIARELATRDVVRGTIETMPRIEDMMAPFSDWISQYVTEYYSDMENPDHVDVLHEFFGYNKWSPKDNTDRTFKALSDVIKRTKEIVKQAQAAASENASKPASEEPSQSAGTGDQATTDQAGPKRLVSDDRMAELKERLRKKLGGQLNVGVDPELLAIGAELAVGHIERGLTKFADYAKAMLEDVGDVIRPYLKSFYNAVRDMPEAEAYTSELTPYDEVRKFDVANFDKEGPKDVLATAKSIVDEQKAQRDVGEIHKQEVAAGDLKLHAATEEDIEAGKQLYHNGEPVFAVMITHEGHQAGQMQFTKPHITSVLLTNGKYVDPSELQVAEETEAKKAKKSSKKKKKDVSSQEQATPSLFSDEELNSNDNDTATTRPAERESREDGQVGNVPADGNGVLDTDGSGRVDGGEPASVPGTSSPVADGARTGIPRRRSGGSAARGNDVAGEAAQPVSDGGRGVRDGASADGRNDAGGAASTTGSVQEKPRGRGGNVKPSSPKQPKFKRNYLYPENTSEIDNMSPQQRLKANVEALELLRDLMRDGREATQDEKAVLGRYRGWGGVDLGRSHSTDAMRHSYTDRWSKPTEQGKLLNRLADVIDELDPEGERGVLQAINRAVLTSYYTPTGIARAMNRFIELAGFKGGTMLDPSMGNGVFEGTMSKGVQQSTMIHGVELDWLTGQIARRLYPDANVLVTGYEQAGTADNAYDVVISNIPFGDISVTDKSWKHDSSPVRRAAQNKIHNYFAVKMLDNTSPGGLCVIMTSNAILDTKGNKLIRQYLADNAEVLGCVRLPDNTFKGAGTQVVTDVIFLRKYKDDADREATRSNTDYIDKIERPLVGDAVTIKLANPSDGKTYDVAVNGYYQSNAKMMIGTPVAGGQYRADQFGLTSDLDSDKLASAFAKLIEKSIIGNRKGKLFDTHKSSREVHQAVSEAYKGDGTYISSGNIVERDGMFGVVTSTRNKYGDVTSTFTEVPSFKSKGDRIRSMLPIRHAMKQVIDWQIQGMKEQDLSQARAALQKAYDDFVKKFGRLNDKANDFLTEDIDGYTLRSLEKWQDGKFAGLSDIFTKNTIKPAIDLTTAKTPREAISLSLAEYGEINPSFMEEILGSSWVEQCGESLYRLPFTQDRYVTDDAYLSGDVKTKLDQARSAAERDKAFERNVAALEAVQPEDIPFAEINIRMGARWVPVEVYTDFMYHLFGIRKNDWKGNKSGVAYLPEADEYKVNVASNELGGEADAWRTSRLSASEIFEAALKDKTRKVYDTIEVDGVEKKVLNKEQTELANGKIQDIRTAFEDWLSQDPNREEMLMRLYNDKFNRIVLRKFDGSHLNVAGLMGKELRPHQKDAVWMLINNRGGIVDHIVGAGKTLVMQSAIMEMRRMGIAKKPMIIGLKATVGQIAKEFREAFPAARILAPTEKDFSKENRKKFMSQIALNDYDCVVLSHDQYCMLPHTEEVERRVIDEQMAQLDAAIEFLYGQSDKSQLTKKQIKGLEKRKANLEAKLASLLDRKIDREFTFEGLGVDYLFVDECQHFKSLPYVSSYDRVAGLGDKKGSQRAIALLNGVRYLQSMHQGDRGTVFLSGTTISNSLSEIYHLLNYLRPSELERMGMTTFDAWAGNFAIHTSELEAGVTNEWKEKDRFRSLTNIPELSKMYAEIADVRNDMNLKLPKPKMRSHIVTVPQTDVMKEINAQIVEMVKTKNGHYFDIASTDKTPWGLLASTLSAKAAINPRLISEDYGDEGGKIPAVCDKVKEIYDKFAAQKGTQLIFCDTGVPQKGKSYDAYTDIINRLVNDYGIPRNEIADIHEADTDEKRKALFAKVNDGAVRILIGGTKNMGTGVNVQRRIVAMHHVDVPWTPADREQREGRGVRQGNEIARDFNDDNVDVYFYATEGSLDMYKYQLQEIKGKLFAQFKSGTIGDRTFDEGDAEGDFDPAEVVAMLSGNPIVLDKSRQDKLVEKLRRAKRAYDSDWQRRRTRYEDLQRKKSNFERLISRNQSDARSLERGGFVADANGKYPATVTVAVNGDYSTRRTFDKPKEAGAYIHELLKKGKVVELSGFGQKATITKPITDAGLFGRPVASMENYGGIKYTVEVSDDDTAAGVAFRNLLQKVYSNGKVYERNLEDVNNQLVGADPGEKAFPKQAELDAAVEKKKELDSEYKKLSDDEEKSSDDESRLREALVEGGRLAISQGENGKWRVEGMPGEFNSRYAAIDEWRERAAGNVVWYLSEDGDYIEVEGNGDMYEMVSRTTTTSGRKRRERLARQQATRSANGRRMVDELADKLGVKVRYVEDMSEQERAQFSERQLRSKGWYNPRTGEVFINLGRHTRLYDILSTFLHETVAHKGLRRLFGKDFNTFLDNVYNNVNKGIRAEIDRMAEQQKSRASEAQRARHDDEHWRRVATEEYIAKLAERLNLNHPEERTIWEKIKGFLLDKLRKIGVTVADSLSDNDLRGILWESYHSMESEGVMGYAKGVAFRDQMEREANNRGTATAHGTSIIAAEPQAQYTGSLFDMLPQAGAWARMMSNMSERELFSEMAQDGPNVTSSYSEEYDRRHIKEYNQACDEIQAQLERELPGEDRLLELLQDAEAQWADGAYKDSRRIGVLAAIDTISRALDEERADLPRVEEDVQAEGSQYGNSGGVGLLGESDEHYHLDTWLKYDPWWDDEVSGEDLANHMRTIAKHANVKVPGMAFATHGVDELTSLKGKIDELLYKLFANDYNDPICDASCSPYFKSFCLFTDRLMTRREVESAWWHEQTHLVYEELKLEDKDKCGREALEWLLNKGFIDPFEYSSYTDEDRGTEGAAWLIKFIFKYYGVDGIVNGNFTGNGKIAKLAAAIQSYFKNGPEDNNRLRQPASVREAGEVSLTPASNKAQEQQGGRADGEVAPSDEDLLFNDSDDDVDVAGFDAGRLTFEESITAGMMKAAADNRAAIAARTAAMRALGGNLSKLRQAMARQREYDRGTVDSIVRLARSVMESGFFRAFSPYEVKRLMSLINHAAGREDITKQAGKVVDLLLKHQLLSCENLLHEQMRTRGSKLNSQGVEVQAGLDIEGQRMVGAMRYALNLDADALQERINNTLDRMFSPDQALADVAAAEYQGLLLAQQYIEDIKGSKQEENELRQELKNAKEDLQAGTITREQYNQFLAETENAIRENRLERVAAYDRLTTALGAGLGASVQRAKEWREMQKERVNEIRHNANSDLEGIPADEHVKPGWMQRAANWSLVRFFMKPLATFDYMLRMLGSKNVNGEGYLWGRFMGGWTEATEREWRNLRAAHKALDEKASEVFGKKMRWSDLFALERKMPGMDVSFWDAGEEKIHHLTQGNLLYIYMVNKMSDGRMKLRKMGITEEDVEAIRQRLDPRFIELADWLQEDFLVNKRNDYNAVYQRMFGASMAAIEYYFPLKINSRSRGQEEDLSSETYLDDNNMGSTITGSIIKRKRNSLPLDVTGADAFDVVLGHLQDMEHWAAFAEFNRDLNTLLSYKRFRNRLLNMSSVRFGSGKTLWMNFKRTCAIASGAYRPKMDRDSVDTTLVNVAKGVTAAKISFRLYTALKQLLSYPAYLSEASGLELIKSSNPIGAVKAWNWAIDELPGFAQRWQSRQAGDSRLRESDADWGLWRNKIVETAGRWGMSPNAFIDGLIVAMGAKAIYETKLKRYRKAGYTDELAKKKALRDASISYNETQQSNANAYLSAMQLDRSATSVALTVFRNASMGYQRRMFQAMANLKHVLFTPGYKAQALEFMTKQMVRDGLSEQQAQQSAERVYRRATYKNLADFAIFGWVMQMAWNLGPYIPYLLMGDDDDDKKEMLEDAALHAIAGGVEGLSGGNVMSDTYNAFRSGEVSSYVNTELLPLMSDIESLKRKLGQDMVEGAHDLVNLAVQAGVGVNPQQITDVVAAVLDVADGDPKIAHEAGFAILRVLSVPQSQLDKLYIDELGLTARDAQKLNAGQMAERYARYRMRRGSAYTSWAYSDEGKRKAEEHYMKRFETKVKERIAELDDEQLEDNFNTDDDLRRKWVGQAVAKRAGGTDSYGSPKTDYGVVYERKRDYTDLAQDILLQVEKKKAKEAGDNDRYKALDRAQSELTNIKKGKHTTKVDEPGLGEGFDDEVMTRLRERRRELLKDLGIM